MRNFLLYVLMGISTIAIAAEPVTEPFKKVVIVVFENLDAEEILAQPTFAEVTKLGAYFPAFHAVIRPSQPNYFAMTAADTIVINNDPVVLDYSNIVDLLEKSNKSWKVYAENYPDPLETDSSYYDPKNFPVPTGYLYQDEYPISSGNCFTGINNLGEKLYVRKHNPFVSYYDITSSKERCTLIVNPIANSNANKLADDVSSNKLSDFSFYIPNLNNNGHNSGPNTSAAKMADNWLKNTLLPIMQNATRNESNGVLFILTFDESNPKGTEQNVKENKVYTLFYGPMVKPGIEVTERYDLYSLLKTVEDSWNLGNLGRMDTNVPPVSNEVWK